MLSPGASSPSIFDHITLEAYETAPSLDARALFDIAFSGALKGRTLMRLSLYTSDVLGTCYRADVEISADDFWRWRGVAPGVTARVWQPPMLPLMEVKKMPEEIPPADFSSPAV